MDIGEINLNPEEVLVHLRQLGYQDISSLQLREFLRDLKKLIKYDLKKQKENANRSSASPVDLSEPSGSSLSRSSLGSDQVDRVRQPFAPRNQNRYNVNSSGSSVPTSSCSELSSTECSSSLDTSSQPETKQKSETKKPRPSFIRPRDLGAASSAPPRSDPVALYHYYQQFWKQFKQPGEDDHRELRWSVRERMMGTSQLSQTTLTSRPRSSSSSLHRL